MLRTICNIFDNFQVDIQNKQQHLTRIVIKQ